MKYLCQNVDSYIFVASTGRSGTESLSKIFQAAKKAKCLHEPYPAMNNDKEESSDEGYFRELFYRKKIIHIHKAALNHKYYIETNHQFIKNFADYAIECFKDKIKIIHLTRDALKVAESFYAIDSIPGKTRSGKSYLLDPGNAANLIKITDVLCRDKDYAHDFYRCIWYWYEIETRTKKYKENYQEIKWFDLNTEDLNDYKILKNMFDYLNIKYCDDKLFKLAGSRFNIKSESKIQKIDEIQAADMHNRLLEIMEQRYGKNFWR